MKIKELMGYRGAAASTGKPKERFDVTERDVVAYPYSDKETGTVHPAAIKVFSVMNVSGQRMHNVVISARRESPDADINWGIWCGDSFLEGKADDQEAKKRCKSACEGLKSPAKAIDSLMESYDSLPASEGCNFWKIFRGSEPELCKHTQLVVDQYLSIALIEEIEEFLSNFLEAGDTPRASANQSTQLLAKLLFRAPVLIEGDRGSGKTVEAHAFAREGKHNFISIQGHEGVEATDLLGHFVRVGDGSMVWKDGGLSQAFRAAAKGIKTLLLIDELLRIPARQQSVILAPLSAIDGHYSLRTGRIVNIVDGIGEEEVLTCKRENLGVVATTNVGGNYNLDEMDPAIAERFVIVRKDTTEEGLTEKLGLVATSKGFSPKSVERLVRFYQKTHEAKRGSQIERTPTMRTLARAMELAANEADLPEMVKVQSLLWIGRDMDGFPIKEQEHIIVRLVNSIFGEDNA